MTLADIEQRATNLRQLFSSSSNLPDVENGFKAIVKSFYDYQNKNYANWFYVIIWNFLKDIDRLFGFFSKSWGQRLVRLFAQQTKCNELDQLLQVQTILNGLSDRISAPNSQKSDLLAGESYSHYFLSNFMSISSFFFWVFSIGPLVALFCFSIGLRNFALIGTLMFSSLCLTLIVFTAEPGSVWDQVKKMFSPRRFNWNQFFRESMRKSGLTLLWVFVSWLRSNPLWTVGYLFLNLVCYSLYRFVQTLAEEIAFRRSLLDEKIDPITKLVVGLLQTVLFALAHYYTLAASWCESLWDYVICFAYHFVVGLFLTIQTLCSGGIELAWGNHLAHNLRIDMFLVLLGLQDCSDRYASLVDELPEIANDSQKSIGFLKSIAWHDLVMPSIGCYATELLFRPRFYVKPVRQFCRSAVDVSDTSSITGSVAV